MRSFKHIASGVLAAAIVVWPVIAQATVTIDLVPVGNPGNSGEVSGPSAGGSSESKPDRVCGAVDYSYQIGEFEITTGQYLEFLNAVAKTDTYSLFHPAMTYDFYNLYGHDDWGCNIIQSGTSGNFTYTAPAVVGSQADWLNRPVNNIDWGDAARFCNWMTNGQPTNLGEATNSTETGSYTLNGKTALPSWQR